MLLIEPHPGNNSRSGNLFLFMIHCISDNLQLYKDAEISLQHVKQRSILFKNMPDVLHFPEFKKTSTVIRDLFVHAKVAVQSYDTIINTYIKPYIEYSLADTMGINFDTDLIIHIRSGDVFNKDNFNVWMKNEYSMIQCFHSPPYSFYKGIIDANKYKKIFIISENYNLNPVINKILANYPNASFLSNDLETDFKLVLHAKYYVPGCSDLSRMCLLLSEPKECVYISKRYYPNVKNITYVDYSTYYNTQITSYEQYIDLILNYTPKV